MDLKPPKWRGQARSTMQAWEFRRAPPRWPNHYAPSHGMTHKMRPSVRRNPYAKGDDVLYGMGWYAYHPYCDWLGIYGGMRGVWRLASHPSQPATRLELSVANCNERRHSKEVWVQITYLNVTGGGAPASRLLAPRPDGSRIAVEIPQVDVSDQPAAVGAWRHRTIRYVLNYCPSDEWLEISPRGKETVLYIDEVVIDTICQPLWGGKRRSGRRRVTKPRRRT
jgi:hypothetical protein